VPIDVKLASFSFDENQKQFPQTTHSNPQATGTFLPASTPSRKAARTYMKARNLMKYLKQGSHPIQSEEEIIGHLRNKFE